MKTVLTIAGSDSSGGAGIQADIKTIMANGCYAMSAITALTAQNTMGVTGIQETSSDMLSLQLDAVFTDIRPDAIKIGMVASEKLIRVIADKIKKYQAEHVVVDTVMVSTSGHRLIDEDAIGALKECLLPIAEVITPNIPEAEVLAEMTIRDEQDMVRAAEKYQKSMAVRFSAREDTVSTMQMMSYIRTEKSTGIMENGSIIRILMEPDAHYQVQSHQILQKGIRSMRR